MTTHRVRRPVVKPYRVCLSCDTNKPVSMYESVYHRRCAACWEAVHAAAVCVYCGDYSGVNTRRQPRQTCDAPECQTERRRAGHASWIANLSKRTSKVCPVCLVDKPLTDDHWPPRRRDPATGETVRFDGYCRSCKRADWKDRYHTDPLMRERVRERVARQSARIAEQRAADPEFDREWREKRRAMNRKYRARRKLQAPPVEDAQGDYGGYIPVGPLYARVVAPRLRAALGEALGAVSSREGKSGLQALPDMTDRAAVKKAIELAGGIGVPTTSVVAAELGVSAKTINEWVRGARPTLRVSALEDILTRTDLLWWDVYAPGDEGYERARELFAGDDLEVAA